MKSTQQFARRYIATPAATAVLVLSAVAAVNAVNPENMTATDGKIEIVDGKHQQELVRQMPLTPGHLISVKNGNGKINVSGWDKDELLITAHKRMTRRVGGLGWVMSKLGIDFETSDDSMTKYFEKVDVKILETESGLSIETVRPKKSHNVNVVIDYTIQVPRNTDLTLNTSNGSIQAADVEGIIESRTSNGRVTYESVYGEVKARTSNGSVKLVDVQGAVTARTSNGSITLDHPEPLSPESSISCTTSNGSVRLNIASDSSFEVTAKSSNGRVRTDFDVDKAGQKNTKHRLNGIVGQGGPLLDLTTSNGSITLNQL